MKNIILISIPIIIIIFIFSFNPTMGAFTGKNFIPEIITFIENYGASPVIFYISLLFVVLLFYLMIYPQKQDIINFINKRINLNRFGLEFVGNKIHIIKRNKVKKDNFYILGITFYMKGIKLYYRKGR